MALTQEDTSLYQHQGRPSSDGRRWINSRALRIDDRSPVDADADHARSVKLAQLTGEHDLQHGGPTRSRSLSRSGIRGTDLGMVVDHRGRTFMLFGDTHWTDPTLVTRDAIAEVVEASDGLPELFFHGSPTDVVGGDVTQVEYDVPLDGFSFADQLFGFFSSDHFADDRAIGRSVLARAMDPTVPIDPDARGKPIQFRFLTTFSSHRFITPSVQVLPRTAVEPGAAGQVLVVWATGGYRTDDPRLAFIPLDDEPARSLLLGDEPCTPAELGTRYFAGTGDDGTARWSASEDDAAPLLWPCALGEICVRWVPELDRYVMFGMPGPEDPIGTSLWLRVSRTPWGPWSHRRQLFDWIADGYGRRDRATQFIHDPLADPPDTVGDDMFPGQGTSPGGCYGAYLYRARVDGDTVSLLYTLSTWNPYQTMLMQHDITRAELATLEAMGPHSAA
jgi:hypothetical protein